MLCYYKKLEITTLSNSVQALLLYVYFTCMLGEIEQVIKKTAVIKRHSKDIQKTLQVTAARPRTKESNLTLTFTIFARLCLYLACLISLHK